MKALNRQQRRAAIWNFVLLYFVTVVLITLTFFLTGYFSDAQYSGIRHEVMEDINKKEIKDLNDQLDKINKNLAKARDLIKNGLKSDQITDKDISAIYDAKSLIYDIRKIEINKELKGYIKKHHKN